MFSQVYYDLYEKDKVRYESELKQLSVRETSSAIIPTSEGTIIDVVGTGPAHQSSMMDSQLLSMDIKEEPL